MAIRSKGPSAGFDWLSRGIGVGFRHPKPLFGGALLLLLAVLLPTLITLPLQIYALRSGNPMQPGGFLGVMVLSALIGLVVFPLYAGYLQVIDAAEQGLAARARDIFKPYREGGALRVIGYGLVMLVVYFVMFALVIAVTGGAFAHWYMQVLSARANQLPPPTALPEGFWTTFLLFGVMGLFMMGFYSIGLGQVALRQRGVLGAVGDGVTGALKNLLPLFMLALGTVLAWILFAIGFAIVIFLIALIGRLISNALMVVLVVPLYIALFLTMFTAMFGVAYHLWRDVCGDDVATGAAEPFAA